MILVFVIILEGCGVQSIEETIKEDIYHLEILKQVETEHGNVVFYRSIDQSGESVGAKLMKKSGMSWDIILGTKIPSFKDADTIAWSWQYREDEPYFLYGFIKNQQIKRVSINDTDANIINLDDKYEFDLFYMLTNQDLMKIQENGEKGIQIKGYSDDEKVIYQRLNFDSN